MGQRLGRLLGRTTQACVRELHHCQSALKKHGLCGRRWLSRENVGSASMIGTVQGGGMNRAMTVLAIVGILAALYFLNKYGLY